MDDLLEVLSEASHDCWMEGKRAHSIDNRKSEWDEELMVPYGELSEKAKDLDRSNIRSVLAAIKRAGFEVVKPPTPSAAESAPPTTSTHPSR